MHNLLIVAAHPLDAPFRGIRDALTAAGYATASLDLDLPHEEAMEALRDTFDGRPPVVLLVDLASPSEMLPLRRAERLLGAVWGRDFDVPARLALLCPAQLSTASWLSSADDFLLPPYCPAEAVARVRLLLFRRSRGQTGTRLSLAGLTIDLTLGQALDGNGTVLPLRPRELDLLRFLVTHRGKFFSRERLLGMVWGVNFCGGERTVDVHIRRLRAKLPPDAGRLLETRHGGGYGIRAAE